MASDGGRLGGGLSSRVESKAKCKELRTGLVLLVDFVVLDWSLSLDVCRPAEGKNNSPDLVCKAAEALSTSQAFQIVPLANRVLFAALTCLISILVSMFVGQISL